MADDGRRIAGNQVMDRFGRIMPNIGDLIHNVTGDVTDEAIFTGYGVLLRVIIWKDVDDGTFTLKNTAGTAIFPEGKTDYVGTFDVRQWCSAGCKITTSGFTGGSMSIIYIT